MELRELVKEIRIGKLRVREFSRKTVFGRNQAERRVKEEKTVEPYDQSI